MTKKTVNSLVRCCAVTGLLLAGAARSEATTLTLTDAGDSVDLAVRIGALRGSTLVARRVDQQGLVGPGFMPDP